MILLKHQKERKGIITFNGCDHMGSAIIFRFQRWLILYKVKNTHSHLLYSWLLHSYGSMLSIYLYQGPLDYFRS